MKELPIIITVVKWRLPVLAHVKFPLPTYLENVLRDSGDELFFSHIETGLLMEMLHRREEKKSG